jgi:WD40 repeat protein
MSRFCWRLALCWLGVFPFLPSGEAPPGFAAAPPSRDKGKVAKEDTPLPKGALARYGSLAWRHSSWVHGLSFSRNGRFLASASADGTACVWSPATGKVVSRFTGHRGPVQCVAFFPDGMTVATGGDDSSLHFWRATTGKQLHGIPNVDRLHSLAVSPNGKFIAAGGMLGVWLFDTRTGERIYVVRWPTRARSYRIKSLMFSPNGKVLAAWGTDSTVRLYEARTGEPHAGPFYSPAPLTFSRAGTSLFTGGKGGINEYDVATGTRLRRFGKHGSSHFFLTSPDGKVLACEDGSCGVRFWDLRTGAELRNLGRQPTSFLCGTFFPDSKRLAVGGQDGVIRLWDVGTAKPVDASSDPVGVRALGFSRDGRHIGIGGRGDNIPVWDWQKGSLHRRLSHPASTVNALAYTPDGQSLVCLRAAGAVDVFDAKTGTRRPILAGSRAGLECLALAADGRTAALGGWDRWVRVWDLQRKKEVCHFDAGARYVPALAFFPDSGKLAVGGYDGSIGIWSIAQKKRLQRWTTDKWPISAVLVSPDGKTLVSACRHEAFIRAWSVPTAKEWFHLPAKEVGTFTLAYSADGKYLAAGVGNTIRVWDMLTRTLVHEFTGHRSTVSVLAFAPTLLALASGGSDSTTLVWDLTGMKLARRGPRAAGRKLAASWKDLSNEGEAHGYRAMWELVAAGDKAADFLRGKLKPATMPSPARLARLVRDLDSDDFSTRERAAEELTDYPSDSLKEIGTALSKAKSAEAKQRARRILSQLRRGIPPPERLAALRAIQALERIGTAAAERVLATLATGAAAAVQTQDAKAAFARLRHRKGLLK